MYQAIEHHFPDLRPAQQRGLVLWVYGTILARSACQNSVIAALLAIGRWQSLRQYLREWLYDGKDKAAPCRTQVEMKLCFGPLLRWLLSWWTGEQLALAIDATTHRDRVSAVVVSVLYRSSAIPVAWHILPGNRPGPWIAPTLHLLSLLGPVVPKTMSVLVLTDRGLWSPRLWNGIRALGWHPLMRVKNNTTFQPQGGCRLPASTLVPGPGHGWVGYRHRFQEAYIASPWGLGSGLGRRPGPTLDAVDRLATAGSWGMLVWPAGLDRTGFPCPQRRWLAVGAYPTNRPS